MTRTSKATKIVALVMTLTMIFGVFSIKGATVASAATDRVSLYSATVTFAKYGYADYEVYVKTNDNASDQKVYVHYYYGAYNQGWVKTEAEYFTTLSDGSKIWKASIGGFQCEYAIEYVADGQTYWDNNNGQNYAGGQRIASAPIELKRLGYQRYIQGEYRVEAMLQNYAYEKNVFVRYTTDGWNTYSDVALRYSDTNADGTENWIASFPVGDLGDGTGFEYAVCYEVNGTQYWANNFGANYDASYCAHQ